MVMAVVLLDGKPTDLLVISLEMGVIEESGLGRQMAVHSC